MRQHIALLSICLIVVAILAVVLNQSIEIPLNEERPRQWLLPTFLREASGLALYNDDYLLTHDDEKADIYRLALKDKSLEKLISIGTPTLTKDFEGIAADGDTIYLATSTGKIFQVQSSGINDLQQRLDPVVFDTGLGDTCEIEGLHLLEGKLLLPCKTPLTKKHQGRLVVFSYDLETGITTEQLNIPLLPGIKKAKLTAIYVTSENYYLLALGQLFVIERVTNAIRVFSLPRKYHAQPEGIAVLKDDSIVIVDDNSNGRARLTHYPGLSALREKTDQVSSD